MERCDALLRANGTGLAQLLRFDANQDSIQVPSEKFCEPQNWFRGPPVQRLLKSTPQVNPVKPAVHLFLEKIDINQISLILRLRMIPTDYYILHQ